MRALTYCFSILFFALSRLSAQEVVAVRQVEMFKTSGTVNGVATSGSETSILSSKAKADPIAPVKAGGTISTGADGAVSLMLGSGAETGSARMGSETEVKLPDAAEKGHSLEMLKGSLFMNIDATQLKQRGGAEFKLKPPAALLAVKGTKFFSSTANGTDTVGVHEGSVELTEPTTGQKLILTAGQAAEVSPGLLSALREMTPEERNATDPYAQAELDAIPLAVFLGAPGAKTPLWAWVDGKVQHTVPSWTAWRRLNSSLWFPQSYSNNQMTAEGGILNTGNRRAIMFRMSPRSGEPVRDSLGFSVRPLIPMNQMRALRFRMRQIGYQSVFLESPWNRSSSSAVPLLADDPAWKVYQLSMPALGPAAASEDSKDLQYSIYLKLEPKEKKYTPAMKQLFEVKDFTLLVLP